MEVHLLLPLFLLHGIALFCAVKGDNMTEEFLVDNHTVTPRPTTMQNVIPPQCDNCTKEMTKHYMTTVLRTDHTTQGPSPPPSPTEYILIRESGEVYLRIKATFIVILNITKIRNVTIPSPPITEAHGRCDNDLVGLTFIFPGGGLWLKFRKNKKESLFYLETIGVGYLKHIRGEEIHINTSVHLKTFITPLGHYFTSKEVNLEVAPDVSVVLLNAKVQAFKVNGGNFGNDNSTTFVKCEFLVDNHTVTPRPTSMQNVIPPQCDNCTKEMTKHYRTTVLHTDHSTQGPSPPPSPREYILIGESGEVYLRIKATFIVILNITEIRNVTIPSPPITEAHGWCYNDLVGLTFIFPGGELWLEFRKSEKESLFYLETIGVAYLKHIRGEEIHTNTSVHLKTFITPLGHYFTSKEVNLEVAPDVSVVLLNAKVQAFEVNGGNFGNDGWNSTFDNSTTFVKRDKSEEPYYVNSKKPFTHWSVTKLVPSIYTVVFLVALPLNIISIVIFLVKMKVRKPAVVYMLNLATADLLLVSVLPFHIVYRFLGSDWIFGDGMCRIVLATFYCNMGCSVQLMASISVDRFLAIVYPVRSLPWRTVNRAWLVCGVIWVISLASFVPLLMKNQIYKQDMQTICHEAMTYDDFNTYYFFFCTTIITLFFLPQLCIITFSYIGIIRSLRRSNVDGTHKRTRAIRLTVVVLSVFVFSFLPIFVIYLIHYVKMLSQDNSFYIASTICSSISSINCCLDPLIYYFASSEIKKYFYRLMFWKKN
ncbi:uncharacterized protein LOC143961561 [Lithobates pipiens]